MTSTQHLANQVTVAGVDGATGGWVMAVAGTEHGSPIAFSVWRSFEDLLVDARARRLLVVGVDIPVGLPGVGRRTADIKAKERLGRRRKESVFHAPAHCSLDAGDDKEAYESNRRSGHELTPFALRLLPKIREVRRASDPDAYSRLAHPRLAEVHPELCFAQLGGETMAFSKKYQSGVAERLAALRGEFSNIVDAALLTPYPGPPNATLQDLLDAAAAAWTARRIASGEAICLGDGEVDETGYPMHIWV